MEIRMHGVICINVILVVVITDIYMIFKFESRYSTGIICGLLSALCASIFSIINSQQIQNRPAPIISFYELIGAWVWVSVYLLISEGLKAPISLNPSDLFFLLILGTICTSLAYVAGVAVMKELSAFRVALVTNLEPVYGIILAFMFFGKKEQMTPGFYAGAIIVLGTIFLYPFLKNVKRKPISKTPIG
jgi:drug/metabolite transporter (DMT)-like permease